MVVVVLVSSVAAKVIDVVAIKIDSVAVVSVVVVKVEMVMENGYDGRRDRQSQYRRTHQSSRRCNVVVMAIC